MIKRYFLPYFMAITIPLFLALLVWQSHRYENLKRELASLEVSQTEWVESNKRLIASITEYSSPDRIERIAKNQLDLRKIPPEYLLQVRIVEGKGHEF
ncbi:MAG: cell division protein FtsL [Treponema sp.]|nr:cell division protein FtsL [Treponema sp.]